MPDIYLALGSNLRRRKDNLQKACNLLEECGIQILKKSKIHETKADSKIKQKDFLNMCIEVNTKFEPEKVFSICQLVEKEMGRKRDSDKRSGYEKPRIIDIDILLFKDKIVNKRNLKIPHPRMHLRSFVLKPLNEIAPHIIHPLQHKTIRQLLNMCTDKSILQA